MTMIKTMVRCVFFCCFCTLLLACEEVETFAPVTELSTIEPLPKSGIHSVKKGETLYEIAWRYGLDYRYLASRNHISAPYPIYIGEPIYLRGKAPVETHSFSSSKTLATSPIFLPISTRDAKLNDKQNKSETIISLPQMVSAEPHYSIIKWTWPAKGKVINRFASDKGVNILGSLGEPIYAAAAGKVVYAGRGLRSYGNLIILKHNSVYLSAYAHNNVLFVKEGEWVRQGQKIAEMGNTGTDKIMLHFEIRRGGRPLNPIDLYR